MMQKEGWRECSEGRARKRSDAEEDNNKKQKRTPHPYFEEVLSRLGSQNVWDNHLPSGENRASVKKTP